MLMVDIISQHSLCLLYVLQAGTYGAAARFSHSGDHVALSHCYLASAFLHGLFGAYHILHFG
jgi:hypothetical protein